MKINVLRTILIILLIMTFFIIFEFSSQNGEESGGLSTKVTKSILRKNENDGSKNKVERMKKTETVIRKLAHFSIYTVVGILVMALLSTYQLKENRKIFISLGIGVLYAISDEIHQFFVPGRSAQITDVMIDGMGVLLGIVVVLTILEISKRIKRYNEKSKKMIEVK